MKKLLISSAIAAAMGTSGFAHAVDFSAGAAAADAVPVTYASEIQIGAAGVVLENVTGSEVLAGTFDFGFGASEGEQRFLRLELSGDATFDGDPTLEVTTDAPVTLTGTKSSGGDGQNFVVFQVTVPSGDAIANTNNVIITAAADGDGTDGANGIAITGQDAVSLSYSHYQLASEAVNQTGALASDSGTLINFESAVAADVNVQSSGNGNLFIDVTQESKFFTDDSAGFADGETVTEVSELSFGLNDIDSVTAGVQAPLLLDGNAATIATLIADSTLVVSGDFSGAFDSTGATVGFGISTDQCATISDADDLTATQAEFAVGANAVPTSQLCFTTDGEEVLTNRAFTAVHEITPVAGINLGNQSLGTIGSLSKNGSTAELNLALTPGGSFSNFVRVTNTSSLAGDVFITVINDDGDTANISLADVVGSAELSARASSRLMSIQSIFDAAVAANSNFGLAAAAGSPKDKLRLIIEGEFPTIDAQSVTLSTDGTTFSTF